MGGQNPDDVISSLGEARRGYNSYAKARRSTEAGTDSNRDSPLSTVVHF